MNATRESAISESFVTIADTLVEDYDVLELYIRLTTDCAHILDVDSAGLLLADPKGKLGLAAASSEHTRKLELFLLQCEQGPCLDAFRTGVPVLVADLAAARDRWPRFVPTAVDAGFASVHAIPMRLRGRVLGALGLFGTTVGALNDIDLALARALAHVACVALISNKAAADSSLIADQLQTALNSRVVLEQAKGILAQLGGLEMEQSFAILRRYSRDRNERLSEVARQLVARELPGAALLNHARAKGLTTN